MQNKREVARKLVVFSEKMPGLFSLGTKAATLHPCAALGKVGDGASLTLPRRRAGKSKYF